LSKRPKDSVVIAAPWTGDNKIQIDFKIKIKILFRHYFVRLCLAHFLRGVLFTEYREA
jgi:hypothetical protein